MTQFISQNALNHIPIDSENYTGNEQGYPPLKWEMFKTSVYLNDLVRNEVGTKPLKLGMKMVEVGYIKLALHYLDIIRTDYTSGITEVRKTDIVFDSELKNAVINFQNTFQVLNNGIADGVVTAKVLSKLDKLIAPTKTKIIEGSDGKIKAYTVRSNYAELSIDENQTIKFVMINRQEHTINVPPGSSITLLEENGDGTLTALLNSPLARELNLQEVPAEIRSRDVATIKLEGLTIDGEQITNPQQLFDIQAKTPPTILSSNNGTVHTVQNGETAVDILQQYYYGSTNTVTIKNPYDDAPIYDFPELTISPISERGNDARLKFYLRFTHFLNTKTNEDGSVTEYGLIKSANFDIDEGFLSDYNLYETGYDLADPDSVYPNYYRMLLAEEGNNSNSRITFDQNSGDCETFVAVEGEKIFIPDRKIIDALYYDINFRYQDWTVAIGDLMDYIPDIQSFIDDIKSGALWNSFTSWFQEETEQLYKKAFEFFERMYDFAIGALSDNWWRGAGGQAAAKVGVTWGYPIYTDFATEKLVYRKMTSLDECVIIVKEEYTIEAGVDVGAGGSIGLFSAAKGRKKEKVGMGLEASASAGLKININNEYEFPVRKEETALLACLVTFTPSLVRQTTELLAMFNLVNFNPRSYLTKSSVEAGIAVQGDVTGGGNLDVQQNSAPEPKSLSVDDIFSKIPSISATIGLYGGIGFVWEGKYTNNPYVPETDRREPSEVSFEINFTVKGLLDFQTISEEFLSDILLSTSLDALFSDMTFDEGFTVGAIFKYERQLAAGQITENYVNLNQYLSSVQPGDLGENNDGMMTIAGTPWQILIQFGTFSGNVEEIATKGNESFLIINPYALYNLAQDATSGSFNFDESTLSAIIGIFHSYRSRYKMGLSTTAQRKDIVNNVLDALGNASAFDEDLKKFINTTGNLYDVFGEDSTFDLLLQGGFSVDVGYEIVFKEVADLICYVFKRLYGIFYLKYLVGLEAQAIQFSNKLIDERDRFKKDWIKTNKNSDDEYDKNELYVATIAHMNIWVDSLYEPSEYDISTINFTSSFEIFSSLYNVLKRYFVHTNSPSSCEEGMDEYKTQTIVSAAGSEISFEEDIELIDYLLPALTSVAQIANLNAAVEAKLGAGLGGQFRLAFLAKIRLEMEVSAALIYRALFYEKGISVDFSVGNDPYQQLFEAIQKWFQTDLSETANLNNERLRGSIVPE